MTETPDRFMIEVGSGTVAHVIDMGASESGTASSSPLDPSGTGEKMCSRGYRDFRSQRVPFSEFVAHHDIDKDGFEGDAPDEICSYCWSKTIKAVRSEQEQSDDEMSQKVGTVGYRLRWKQKGRARDEWYDIVVRPETTMAELDRLVCRFTTLDDFHLRMYGLENEYLDSSLKVLPDRQYEKAGDRSYTRASEMTIKDVAERARLQDGDRLSLVYDFGTPSHYYCIVKDVYEPEEIDEILGGNDVISATDTAAIVKEKRP
ncbi:MAG: hypothetical protein V5A39_04915 [Haloarculaceae archaeon]